MRRLGYLIRKEFIQLFRSKPMVGVTFGPPFVMLIVLGFAISGDIVQIPTSVTDLDNSAMSRKLVEKLTHTRYLDVRHRPADIRETELLLRRGDVIISVTVPKDFGRDLVRGEVPALSLAADAQNTSVALTGAGYVTSIAWSWARNALLKTSALPVKVSTIDVESRIWYNPELRSVYFMVPGIVAVMVTIITIILTALAIVRERGDKNTLEQLMVTPISRLELILGKTIPFGIMGMVELSLVLVLAKLVFNIIIVGPLADFYLMSAVFMLSSIGLGIFVSTVTSTQQQALFTAWFIMVFCLLMSGFFLPLDNMPPLLYKLTYLNPLRYYVTIVRELFLKGSGLGVLWRETAALGAIAVVVLTLAVSRFQKRLG